ncbi:MAG TPA: hypothetical protein VGA37_07730 [Gemmatimonadales bacterium]
MHIKVSAIVVPGLFFCNRDPGGGATPSAEWVALALDDDEELRAVLRGGQPADLR